VSDAIDTVRAALELMRDCGSRPWDHASANTALAALAEIEADQQALATIRGLFVGVERYCERRGDWVEPELVSLLNLLGAALGREGEAAEEQGSAA
jgi:hypothetical protein